ncbi:site-specific integrase [Kordiimonas sp. SCSIO 12603]|uniref:tyrosine-type recombinase/integrase n=1 Tax=Kordiimonas sp. SCSIO 12603 TaxID=2829596 RepID=UPI002102BCC6|nr:site-specific integrase [Kordiimonas sp. SCSIO 12603]UTW59665.1 site-specific integrase [Kordiimonas sp. SCSIO 12603]
MDILTMYVFKPNSQRMKNAGYTSIFHIPIIVDTNYATIPEANWFLRERALGEINKKAPGRVLAERTIVEYAYDLKSFFSWLDGNKQKYQWQTIDYYGVIHGFQNFQMSSISACTGRALSRSFVSRRVEMALDFLNWAHDQGLRSSVNVLKKLGTEENESRRTHINKVDPQRKAKELGPLPSAANVQDWLQMVEEKCGRSKALACYTVIRTGLRVSEIANLPTHIISDECDTDKGLRVTIKYGAKGKKAIGDEAMEGKPREVYFPQDLVKKLYSYKNGWRIRNLAVGKKYNKEDKDRMFLGDDFGQPLSPQTIREAWKSCDRPSGLRSPHKGRDYWACRMLYDHMTSEQFKVHEKLPYGTLVDAAFNFINLRIRPQLGHSTIDTTFVYLEWLFHHTSLNEMNEDWREFLLGAEYS